MSHNCSLRFWQYGELNNASSSAFGLFEFSSFGGVDCAPLLAYSPGGAGLATAWLLLDSKSRKRSRAEGVKIASLGRLLALPPLPSNSSMSLALMTVFIC